MEYSPNCHGIDIQWLDSEGLTWWLSVKNWSTMQETWVRLLGWEDPLEEGMATHSNILAWRSHRDRGAWRDAVRGGTVDKNLPANAGEIVLILVWEDSTKACAPQLLEPMHSRTCEPQLLSPECWNYWSLCSTTRESTTMRRLSILMKSHPYSPQKEKAWV